MVKSFSFHLISGASPGLKNGILWTVEENPKYCQVKSQKNKA